MSVRAVVRTFVAAVVLAAVTSNALPAPAATTGTATVSVVGSAVKVRPVDQPNGSAGASLTAARNEFESFQVVVAAGASPLTGLSVALDSPLAGPGGTIPASNVTV